MVDSRGRKEVLDMEEGHALGEGEAYGMEDRTTTTTASKKAHRAHPLSAPSSTKSKTDRLSAKNLKASTRNFCGLFFSPVFAQAFILTFLGEWGDRSQIATIALAGVNVRRRRSLFPSFTQLSSLPPCLAGHFGRGVRNHPRPLYMHGDWRPWRSSARNEDQYTDDNPRRRCCFLGVCWYICVRRLDGSGVVGSNRRVAGSGSLE